MVKKVLLTLKYYNNEDVYFKVKDLSYFKIERILTNLLKEIRNKIVKDNLEEDD